MRRKSWTLESLEPRMVLDSTVVFNELLYNPATSAENLEWIELHNQMAIDMDISGWTLADGLSYTFPGGTVVRGGGRVVVAADPVALAAAGVTGALGPWVGSLSNGGERIELVSNSDRVMDTIDYRDSGDWPVGPDGSGSTLAKIDPLSGTAQPENWRTSRQIGGTPGAANFPPPGNLNLPTGVVSYWNFDEASGAAVDVADGNNGTLGAGATRVPGPVGAGAISFNDTAAAYVSVGAGTGNNFSVTSGVALEAVATSDWDGTGSAEIFRKTESPGATLISHWNFDETDGPAVSNVPDLVGANHGTYSGGAVRVSPGIVGAGAGSFNNATATGVNVGNGGTANTFSMTTGITLGAWIKPLWNPTTSPTYDDIFRKNDSTNRILLGFQFDANNAAAQIPVTAGLPVLSFGLNTAGYKELDMPLGVDLSALAGGNPSSGTVYLDPPPVTPGPGDVVLKDGNPHYVTATYTAATGEKSIYIDGVKRWSATVAGNPNIVSGGAVAAYIGNTAGLNEPFTGLIDEMAFYNNGLSAAQVAGLAGGAAPGSIAGLVSHWSFDATPVANANSALDPIGGNTGTFAGTAVHAPGIFGLGSARIKNATGDAVNVGAGVNNNFSVTQGITLSAWIKPEWSGNSGDWDEIFRKEDGGNRILLSFQNDGANAGAAPPVGAGPVLSFGLNTGGVYTELDMLLDGLNGRPTLAQLKDGNPHHVAATYDAATGKKSIWIDGTERWSTTLAGTITSGGTAQATIGNLGPGSTEPYNGLIDEMAIWNGALAAAQIGQLAAGTLPTAISAVGGPGNRVHLGFQNDGNNASANPPVAAGPVLSFGLNVGGVYSELDMPLDGQSGRPTLADMTGGMPHHIVAAYDQSTGKKAIYIDGAERFSTTLSGGVNSGGQAQATIGNSAADGADPFDGTIDEVAFWNKSLAPVEVAAHWQEVQAHRNYFAPLNPSQIATADLALNETAAGGAGYWLEIVNRSGASVDLAGHVLASPAGAGARVVLPSLMLLPGAHVVVTAAQMGFTPQNGDRLFLLDPSERVLIDALAVDNELRGRYPDASGRWLWPDAATPGAANHFAFHDEVVINEIMYHNRPLQATPGTPATFQTTTLVPIDAAKLWRYNRNPTNVGLATDWYKTTYTTAMPDWSEGAALIGFETSPASLPEPIRTPLPDPASPPASPFIRTYYFQTTFNVADPAAIDLLQLRHVTDDGAVYYLNGSEAYRYNMPGNPGDPVLPSDIAPTGIDNATYAGPVALDKTKLVAGTNVFSVEVHQGGVTTSSDIVFGAELTAAVQLTPGIPGTPFMDSPEEWIELYNKSASPVDLTGWQLDNAVNYAFPAGTMLAAGEYLVVANDPVALALAHPTIRILGPYSGGLSNGNERIALLDPRKNPADEVHYYDGGRWNEYADGGGASLELRDPDADNSLPEAWAASDEGAKSAWKTYTYRGIAANFPSSNNPRTWNEFSLGLLTAGEVLLDDIHVIENPSGARTELLQNSTFVGDTLGGAPATWRVVGDHKGTVIADPADPNNKVLRMVATFPEEHLQNHAETTLKVGGTIRAIQVGTEYEISYKAKWIGGSNALNSRLFFNFLPRTTILDVPASGGTPGAKNSVLGAASEAAANVGPTYAGFGHGPTVPTAAQPIAVSVVAADPQGVSSVALKYSVNGGAWQTVAMAAGPGGQYAGNIPGQAALAMVQFYVEGTDSLGAVSTFPGQGAASRALVRVQPGITLSQTLHNIQIWMTPSDGTLLNAPTNQMSNDRIGATVVYQNKVYYDVHVRLKGSEHGRPDVNRRGFFIEFHPDDLFRGVQETVAIDRSGGWRFGRQFGQDEIMILQYINRAGNLPVQLSDLVYVDAPGVPTGTAILQMSRFSDVFLDGLYDNGGDGMLYEYELIYAMQESAGAETLKYAQEGPSAIGVAVGSDMGADKEAYRHHFLIKNNRVRDDYGPMMSLAKTMSTSGAAFNTQSAQVLDLDEWMRAFAALSLSGAGDNYQSGAQHNAAFYQRPSDGKMLLFPFDMDFAFTQSATAALSNNGDLNKMLLVPNNNHAFLGHLHDMINVSYNRNYLAAWSTSFSALLPGQNFSTILDYVDQRRTFVLGQLPAAVDFRVTTASTSVAAPSILVQGNGWVNARTIRVVGRSEPLDVTWTSTTAWQATVQLAPGPNTLSFQAFDFQGNPISTPLANSIDVTSTVPRPLIDNLRIDEVMYHPSDPTTAELAALFTDADDFEFLELVNIGGASLDLTSATLSGGVSFTFPATPLAPGARSVLVANRAAFEFRHAAAIAAGEISIAGQYAGQLNNAGERLLLADAPGGTILDFTYDDDIPWHPTTDGAGYSLVIINPAGNPTSWNTAAAWRPSHERGGSPGVRDLMLGDVNADNRVDLVDAAVVQMHLGTAAGATRADGDLNRDGRVNRIDAALLAQNVGRFYNPPIAPSPPSPSPSRAALSSAAVAVSRVADPSHARIGAGIGVPIPADRTDGRRIAITLRTGATRPSATVVDAALRELRIDVATVRRGASLLARRTQTAPTPTNGEQNGVDNEFGR